MRRFDSSPVTVESMRHGGPRSNVAGRSTKISSRPRSSPGHVARASNGHVVRRKTTGHKPRVRNGATSPEMYVRPSTPITFASAVPRSTDRGAATTRPGRSGSPTSGFVSKPTNTGLPTAFGVRKRGGRSTGHGGGASGLSSTMHARVPSAQPTRGEPLMPSMERPATSDGIPRSPLGSLSGSPSLAATMGSRTGLSRGGFVSVGPSRRGAGGRGVVSGGGGGGAGEVALPSSPVVGPTSSRTSYPMGTLTASSYGTRSSSMLTSTTTTTTRITRHSSSTIPLLGPAPPGRGSSDSTRRPSTPSRDSPVGDKPSPLHTATPTPALAAPAPPTREQPRFKVGFTTKRSPFHRNEDRVAVFADLQTAVRIPLGIKTSLFVCADGHGGAKCAEYIVSHFPTELRRAAEPHISASTPNWEEALRLGFAEVEKSFCAIARKKANPSGACLTIAALAGDVLTVAGVGDCRAVLRTADGRVQALTIDHRSSDPEERKRIVAAGGFVKMGRVLGVLEPSRTIGDVEEKPPQLKGVVSAVPDIATFILRPEDIGPGIVVPTSRTRRRDRMTPSKAASMGKSSTVCCLVIATDGVWDVLKNETVMTIAAVSLETHGSPDAAARAISTAAVQRRSADDISVIVIWFH